MIETPLLDTQLVKKNITHPEVEVHVLQTVDSTQSWLKTFKHQCDGIVCCIAEQQTQGRGRFNRPWLSPFGENIYLSCLYPFQKNPHTLSGLSIVASLAVIKTLQDNGLKVAVKWPNDIMHEQQKLSGCLVDIHGDEVLIGIGLNVNSLDSEGITQPWTSLRKITHTAFDRNLLCAQLINQLLDYLQRFENEGLVSFLDEWRSADYLLGKAMTLTHLGAQIEGKVLGINVHGQLLLECADGKVCAFSSGETSTRNL